MGNDLAMRVTRVPPLEVIKQQMTGQMWLCFSYPSSPPPPFPFIIILLMLYLNLICSLRSSGNQRTGDVLTSHESGVKTEQFFDQSHFLLPCL